MYFFIFASCESLKLAIMLYTHKFIDKRICKDLNQYFDAQVKLRICCICRFYFTCKRSKMAAIYTLQYIAGFRRIKFLPTSNSSLISTDNGKI